MFDGVKSFFKGFSGFNMQQQADYKTPNLNQKSKKFDEYNDRKRFSTMTPQLSHRRSPTIVIK